MDLGEPKTEATGGTIGFQPVKGEVVKSVVFSQWTKLLDRSVFFSSPPNANSLLLCSLGSVTLSTRRRSSTDDSTEA